MRNKPIPASSLPDTMLLKKFTEVYGYSSDAVHAKIRTGAWMEGREYTQAPDKKIHIILDGYKKWLFSESEAAKRNLAEGYFADAS